MILYLLACSEYHLDHPVPPATFVGEGCVDDPATDLRLCPGPASHGEAWAACEGWAMELAVDHARLTSATVWPRAWTAFGEEFGGCWAWTDNPNGTAVPMRCCERLPFVCQP